MLKSVDSSVWPFLVDVVWGASEHIALCDGFPVVLCTLYNSMQINEGRHLHLMAYIETYIHASVLCYTTQYVPVNQRLANTVSSITEHYNHHKAW